MSSFYDRWFRIAQHCAEHRVEPALACEMHRRRVNQARAYYTWVSNRRDARKALPSPDPTTYPEDTPLLRIDWLYADALEEIIGSLPRDDGLYGWAQAALDRLEKLPVTNLYGPEGTGWSDWTPWGLFGLMVIGALHTFAHFVARITSCSDNPYSFDRRIPNWADADEWCREHGFPV